MSDAPERIWTVHWNANGAVMNGAWADTIRHFGGGVEYIRADKVDALAKAAKEVGRISARDHVAWQKLAAALRDLEAK